MKRALIDRQCWGLQRRRLNFIAWSDVTRWKEYRGGLFPPPRSRVLFFSMEESPITHKISLGNCFIFPGQSTFFLVYSFSTFTVLYRSVVSLFPIYFLSSFSFFIPYPQRGINNCQNGMDLHVLKTIRILWIYLYLNIKNIMIG